MLTQRSHCVCHPHLVDVITFTKASAEETYYIEQGAKLWFCLISEPLKVKGRSNSLRLLRCIDMQKKHTTAYLIATKTTTTHKTMNKPTVVDDTACKSQPEYVD